MEIDKKHPMFAELYLTCKCLSKDDSRLVLQTLNVTPGEVQATDDHRAARMKNCFGLDAGRYEVGKLTKSQITLLPVEAESRFPNLDDVFPAKPTDRNGHIEYTFDVFQALTLAAWKLNKAGFCLNLAYLKPIFDIGLSLDFAGTTAKRPVLFYNKGLDMIIMPMNPS